MDTREHLDSTTRLGRALHWLQATPAELVGLAVLVVGALVVTGLLWAQAAARPDPAALIGVDADGEGLDGLDDGVAALRDDAGSNGPGAGSNGSGQAPDVAGATGLPAGIGNGAPGPGAPAVSSTVTVHVTGAVARPGVVTLPAGARAADAVAAAGGAAADAALERVNLARVLEDGEHLHLPRPGDDVPLPTEPQPGASSGVSADGRIDLNRASQDELETLPGIGPSKAAAIIQHRETHGPFSVPGDLRDVAGIGEATFQRLAELVTVG